MGDTEMSESQGKSKSPDVNTNAPLVTASTNSPAPAISEKSPSPEDAIRFEKDLAALNEAIKSAAPDVARAAVRRNWRKCITGSVHDESFFVRAIFKHCTDHIFKRSLEEYGDKFLHVATADFLDQAMETRLFTIGAKELVAILAKAKRLGYDEMDIVDDNVGVLPAEDESDSDVEEIPPPTAPAAPPSPPAHIVSHDQALQTEQMNIAAAAMASLSSQANLPTSNQANLPSRRKSNGTSTSSKVCPACGASFAQSAGLKYHMDNKVCQKPPRAPPAAVSGARYQCGNCGKAFTNPGGFKYHTENKVCGNHERAAPTSPSRQLHQEHAAVLPPLAHPHPHPHSHPVPHQLPPLSSVTYQPAPPIGSQILQHGPYAAGPPALMQPPPNMPLERGPYNYPPNPPLQTNPAWQANPPLQALPRASTTHPLAKTPTSQSPAVLSPARQEEMNIKLANEQLRLDKELSEIPENATSIDRKEMVDKIKRNSATRKSIIRRSYGVQMRKSKIASANAVTTPEGGIELLGAGTPPSASAHSGDPAGGFQPINRLDAFRAPQEVAGQAPGGPPHMLSHHPPTSPSGPDAKRRRVNDQNGPPPTSLPPHGPHLNGPPTGSHLTSAPPNGPHLTGPSPTGPHLTGPPPTGPHLNSPLPTGLHLTGPPPHGPHITGPHATGPAQTGPPPGPPRTGPPPSGQVYGHANGTPPEVRTEIENRRVEWQAFDPKSIRPNPSPPSEYTNIAPKTPTANGPIDGAQEQLEAQKARSSPTTIAKPESPLVGTRSPLKSTPVPVTSSTAAVETSSDPAIGSGSDSDEEIPAKKPSLNQNARTSSGSPVTSLKLLNNGNMPTRQLRNGSKTIVEGVRAKRASRSS